MHDLDESNTITYRNWTLERQYLMKSRDAKPSNDCWTFIHDNYDGPNDGDCYTGPNLCGIGPTAQACRNRIDEIESELEDRRVDWVVRAAHAVAISATPGPNLTDSQWKAGGLGTVRGDYVRNLRRALANYEEARDV